LKRIGRIEVVGGPAGFMPAVKIIDQVVVLFIVVGAIVSGPAQKFTPVAFRHDIGLLEDELNTSPLVDSYLTSGIMSMTSRDASQSL